MKKILLFLLCFSFIATGSLLAGSENYVTVKDGHFSWQNRRLRLWGVNVGYHHTGNFAGAEITAKRMKDMGFNAVHLWTSRGCFHNKKKLWTDFVPVTKGSQRGLDLFDYFAAQCFQNGLFVSLPTFSIRRDMITADVYDLAPRNDIDKTTWFKLLRKSKARHFRFLKFVDPSIRQAYIIQMKYFLNRVNPYTGKKYAEEPRIAFYQLEDELQLLSWPTAKLDPENSLFERQLKPRWEAFLKQKYGTTEKMQAAWGKLYNSETIDNMKALFYPGMKRTPDKRATDCWKFCYKLTDEYYTSYLKELRAQAPKDVGANVVPVAVDSIIYSRPGNLYNTVKNSTFVCGTGMNQGGALRTVGGKTAWMPIVKEKPPFFFHKSLAPSILKVKGMPYCPVAGADLNNNPYRALTPFFRGLWASFQDWDGVYTYWWGYPTNRVKLNSAANYENFPLAVCHPKAKRLGRSILNDETNLAVHKLASHIFRNFMLAPAANPTIFTFGKKALFTKKAASYYHRDWDFMSTTAYTKGAELAFDPTGSYDLKNRGKIVKNIKCPLKWSNGVTWNWKQGYIKIDTPEIKGYAGYHNGTVTFSDNISLTNIDRKFIIFLMSPETGKKSLKNSKNIMLCLVSKSQNSGFKEDMSKAQLHPYGYPLPWSTVTNIGQLPIKFERVSADLNLPGINGKFITYNFAMKKITQQKFTNKLKISGKQPIFFARIKK
ncbi:MAG: beta-galactosidase [Victivallaceae bacterium]|nr:beta-galactosidase [Victivallaceae bacterium]